MTLMSARSGHTNSEREHPSINGLLNDLGGRVRAGAAERPVDGLDVEVGVDTAAAMLVAGYEPAAVNDTAEHIGEAAAGMASLDIPADIRRTVDWSPFGQLIPVVSGSPGAGASVVAAAITDALQLASRCVLLIDAADPARSGLCSAAAAEGPVTSQINAVLRVRYSWREHALLARLESSLPVISAGMVPPPPLWLPELSPLHVTVVDVGHDGWRATANPLVGAGGWLRRGTPSSYPVLVVRPTRPSLRHAEQVLARLDPWVEFGTAATPVQLVVTGAKRWPGGVVGAAGRRLEPLLEAAVFLPHDYDVEVGGVTDELLGDKLLAAVTPMLANWGVLPPTIRSRSRFNRRTQS